MSSTPASPPARRLAAPRWLDTRLVLGVLLVLVSVVVGARVLASADDAAPVWALSRDLAAGSTITAGDLERSRVRLLDDDGRYVPAPGGSAPPVGYVLERAVGAGELLPRAALRPPGEVARLRDVAVPVEEGHLPADLRAGQLVDVYVTAGEGPGPTAPAAAAGPTGLVLRAVPVAARPGDDGRGAGAEQVVLSVPEGEAQALVAALRAGAVDLVRVPDAEALPPLPEPAG